MASRKQQRKAVNRGRKQRRLQTGPFRHRDGDRRHRGSMAAGQKALAQQRLLEEQGWIPVDEPPPDQAKP